MEKLPLSDANAMIFRWKSWVEPFDVTKKKQVFAVREKLFALGAITTSFDDADYQFPSALWLLNSPATISLGTVL